MRPLEGIGYSPMETHEPTYRAGYLSAPRRSPGLSPLFSIGLASIRIAEMEAPVWTGDLTRSTSV